jgi:membrane protease YdiL (CAAX protease family)
MAASATQRRTPLAGANFISGLSFAFLNIENLAFEGFVYCTAAVAILGWRRAAKVIA